MKFAAIALVLISAGLVAAQASGPSSAPATEPQPQTQAATAPSPSLPVTLPSVDAASQPATQEAINPATTLPATEPTTGPTTGPAGFATSGPAYRSFSSYSSNSSYNSGRRDYFRSNTPPATNLAGLDFRPKPYPGQYSALLSRSIFLKGSQRVRDSYIPPDARRPPQFDTTRPVIVSTPYVDGILVFNGATNADGKMVAFIENTGMNQIARYQVGDPVGQGAPGKITAITLDSIDYTVGARVTHVTLGQDLTGHDHQILTTQPVAETLSSAGGTSGTTQPSSSTDSNSNVSDIERRMRERRMKELSQ